MDLQAPLPPPPPPPKAMFTMNHHQAPSNLNTNGSLSDRSQLLIDIERGTTLKKVSTANRPLHQVKQVSVSSFHNC